MKEKLILISLFVMLAVIVKYSFNITADASENNKEMLTAPDNDMEGWSKASKMAVMDMKKKYGEPDEKTGSMMIWKNKGPWKKSVVFAKEHKHDFPMPHTDVLQQYVEYKVPAEKFDDLAMFDGSVVCNRTNGDISARCDKEEANILALNLADDIITGKKDVKTARDFYAKSIKEMINGGTPEYTQKLRFDTSNMNSADVDERSSIITDEDVNKAKQMMEKKEKELKDKDMKDMGD